MHQADLFSSLESGRSPVLCANRRLANHLIRQYDAARLAAGETAWERPEIVPLSEWVRREWEAGLHPEAVLTEHQALAVWERIVEADEAARPLLDRRRLARRALEAWTRCGEWQCAPDWGMASPEVEAFVRWGRAFRAECARHGWVDAAGAQARLIDLFASGELPAPDALRLVGFDTIPPLVERMMAVLREKGCRVAVETPATSAGTGEAVRVTADDPEAEAELCARWVRGRLEAGAAQVAIVAPSPEAVRFSLLRALRDQLAPGAVAGWGQSGPVSVSLGLALAHTPPVAAALALLGVDRGLTEADRWGRLLCSPFLVGAESEASVRGALHQRLLGRGPRVLSPPRLREWLAAQAEGEHPFEAPGVAALLAEWIPHLERSPARARPSQWAVRFQELLTAIGWPGERALDSEAYQMVQRWEEARDQFAALDPVLAPIPRREAVRRLEAVCRELAFQPQETGPAQVALLGTLEASGLAFSHLWVMGMADTVWPAAPDPNPFIPYRLQREQGMPHASPEVQLEHARVVTGRLLAAAPQVVVSHPARMESRDTGPSPLIAHLPEVTPEHLASAPDLRHARRMAASGGTESLVDATAPPVPADVIASGGVRGGVALFADQAACPFRAFAKHRLAVRGPEEPGLGLSAADRGDLVHQVMERLWNQLKSRQALDEFSDDALEARIVDAVEPVVAQSLEKRGLGERFLSVERERLIRLVREWLDVERKRGPFEVLGTEVDTLATIGGVPVNMRLDRIDRLPDGREVLIDYKTGITNGRRKDWEGERPRAPQLPLYALTRPEGAPAAVAFARLKRGDLRYDGVAAAPDILPPNKSKDAMPGEYGFGDLLAQWRSALEGLATAFVRGDAAVDPLDGDTSCNYCGLTPLCRYQERGGDDAVD